MGSHTDSYQTLPLQDIYLVGQGGHLGEFEWSWLFTPCSLEFGKSANEGREARFMVFTIEPSPVPSP
jgi:hypothetical protein